MPATTAQRVRFDLPDLLSDTTPVTPSSIPAPASKFPKPWVEEVEDEEVGRVSKSRWNQDHTAFIDFFPSAEAGALISDNCTHEIDLCAYIQACGVLADPEQFEVAELLMTTGLTNSARDRFLKSRLVS
jgi:hypothetical protein